MRPVSLLPTNILLLIVGLADLITTIFWLHSGQAIEMNPLMAGVLSISMLLFVAVKISTLGAFVAVIEWYRRHRSASLARFTSKATLIAYIGIYSMSFLAVNHGFLLK